MMQKYVKAKYKIFGSVKSSFTKLLKKNKIIKYDLLYISPFRSMNLQTKNNIRQNLSQVINDISKVDEAMHLILNNREINTTYKLIKTKR